MDQQPQTPAHVLIFPLPLQGPVNSMLKLAELLCLRGLHITFLVTDHMYARLHRHSNIRTGFQCYPGFRILTISDGLPENHPRGEEFLELFESLSTKTKPLFKELLLQRGSSPISCVIADGVLGFTCDVANDVGIPILYVRTISAACLWLFFSLPNLIQFGDLPFQDDNLDEIITNVPGMEGIIRRRDLPSFCRTNNLNDRIIQEVLKEHKHIPLAQGLILNTFQHLEAPILSQILNICPNIYSVGPLHAHLKTRLAAEAEHSNSTSISICLWEEDKNCISWLNKQPSKSVIYVSVGTLAVMTKQQMYEIWHGLVSSGTRFLWVRRPGSVIGLDSDSDEVPPELARGTDERGCMVSWAPQEEVLAHPAVGGFLTHSGWNSTLESIVSGKPMICWPYFVDQQVNSRYVEAVWKLGLDMKDTCHRVIVEKMVKELMELRKDEFLQRADEMAKLAISAVSSGGSSSADMDRLVEDIKMMKITK